MPDGTVTGVFDLRTPALQRLRELRTEGERTDLVMKRLGDRLDRIGTTAQVTRIRALRDELTGLSRTAQATAASWDDAWRRQTRVVSDQVRLQRQDIRTLKREVDGLSRERATPKVEVQGLGRALADVELLKRELRDISRTHATATVGARGGATSAARAAASGGGRGGGLGGLLSANIPLGFTSLPVAALPFALPAVTAAAGGLGSIAGVLGSGAIGAGALGLSGLGTGLAGGLLPTLAVFKPLSESIQKAQKATDAYDKVVQRYGAHSKQAAVAQQELNRALKDTPAGTRNLLAQTEALENYWRRVSLPAQRNLVQLGEHALTDARRGAPALAGAATTATGAIRSSGGALADFLVQRQQRGFLTQTSQAFAQDLPIVERTVEHVAGTLEHLIIAGRPFLREALTDVEQITARWDRSTGNLPRTRDALGTMVGDAGRIANLTTSTGRLIIDVLRQGRGPGAGLLDKLTAWINAQDRLARADPARLQRFFQQGTGTLERFTSAVSHLFTALWDLGRRLQPFFDRLVNILNVIPFGAMANFSVLGGGGAIGLTAQSLAGGRGGAGAGGASTAGTAAALSALGGRAAAAEARGVADYSGMERAGRLLYGPGYRYGGPVSMTAAGPRMGARAGALARGAGALVGRYAAISGLLGLADAAGATNANLGQRLQIVASDVIPFVPRPMSLTGDELRQHAMQATLASAARGGPVTFGTGTGLGSGGYSVNLRPRVGFPLPGGRIARAPLPGRGALPGISATGDFTGRGVTYATAQATEAGLAHQQALLLRQLAVEKGKDRDATLGQIDAVMKLRAAYQDLMRTRQQQSAVHGQAAFQDITGAFTVRARSQGPQAAMGAAVSETLRTMRGMRPEGARILDENMLAWARQQAQSNPKLWAQYDRLRQGVEDRFSALGKNVKVINDQIITDSSSQWAQIRRAIGTQTEQALEETTTHFTLIQREAVAALELMGYAPGQAGQLVRAAEGPHPFNLANAGTGVFAPSVMSANAQTRGSTQRAHRGRARGGRLGGLGLSDHLALGGGLYGAPGELIVNRHTEARVNRLLGGRTSLAQEVRREGRPHWAAYGDRVGGAGGFVPEPGTNFSRGAEPQIAAALGRLAALMHTTIYGISGYRSPEHSVAVGGFANDPHTLGIAADIGVGAPTKASAYALNAAILRRVGLYRPFFPASAAEVNHVQLLSGGARGGGLAGVAGPLAALHLRAPRSGLGGVPGALSTRAGALYAHALSARVNARIASAGGGGFTGGGDANANQALAHQMLLAGGWGADQWGPLQSLWTRESGFRTAAANPSSGAFGIPQALPASKMASAGPDWRTNPATQIKWGLGYIRGRYGSPASAWRHEQQSGWYARGGRLPFAGWAARGGTAEFGSPTLIGVGDRQPTGVRERVTVEHVRHGTAAGGRMISVQVNMGGVRVYNGADVNAMAKRVGEVVVKELSAALDAAEERRS